MDNDSMDRYLKEEDEGIAYVEYAWKPPSCKYCGKSNLQWKQNRKGKWALYTEKGTKHTCKESKLGFPKIGKTEVIK